MNVKNLLGAGVLALTTGACTVEHDEYASSSVIPGNVNLPNGRFENCDIYTDSFQSGEIYSDQELADLCNYTSEQVVSCVYTDSLDGGNQIFQDDLTCQELYNGTRSIDYEYAKNRNVYNFVCVPGWLEEMLCR